LLGIALWIRQEGQEWEVPAYLWAYVIDTTALVRVQEHARELKIIVVSLSL